MKSMKYAKPPKKRLEERLACFNSTEPWHLGSVTGLYLGGQETFLVPDPTTGMIVSLDLLEKMQIWLPACIHMADHPSESLGSALKKVYTIAPCLSDVAQITVTNYADDRLNFVKRTTGENALKLIINGGP